MPYTFKHGDRPLDEFTIQRAVGVGGFGEVYYALSDGGREVALKYLKSNPHVELRGVSHCINLKSPHLVSIFDVKKSADDEYFIVMEYCSGPSLRDLLIAEPNGFGTQKAAFFVREIAKGLAYLHDRGIVHRDLKPGNIFYDDGYVKIGDYGLSKFISVSRHSAQTASVGTVHYMAPEIASGNYSRGVDIYALGVMLYEMLRGRVPFEGSSMGEVLMKHLTAQPELDELPHPFAEVIRRALQKDPQDRYPTVDEMVDDLLAVDQIKDSLAGFSTKSLEGAVRCGTGDRADSPIPSPNPPPAFRRDPMHFPARKPSTENGTSLPMSPLPPRLAKRVDRIARKVDQKVGKLMGKAKVTGGRLRTGDERSDQPFAPFPHNMNRGKCMLLTAILLIGMAVGLGVVMGNTLGEDAGFAAGMLAVAMPVGLLLSRRAVAWFGAMDALKWPERLIRACCCAPLLAMGSIPLFDSRYSQAGLGVWLGLLAVAIFADWTKAIENAAIGELSFGRAIGTAFGGLVATGIASGFVGGVPETLMFLGAGVAGVASLVMQASGWWQPGNAAPAAGASANRPFGSAMRSHAEIPSPTAIDDSAAGLAIPPPGPPPLPFARRVEELNGPTSSPIHMQRSTLTRGFFGLLTFLSMGGAIVLLLVPLIVIEMDPFDTTGAIIGCIACASAMVFALRKTTPIRPAAFWQDSLRPFLMMVGMFGVGATITGMVRHWYWFDDESRVMIIIGLVFSSLMLLGSVFPRAKTSRVTRPFLRDSGDRDGVNIFVDAANYGAEQIAVVKTPTPAGSPGQEG